MTPSNGNIFRVTGLLCGEFTGHRWIPRTKASDVDLWCFIDLRLNIRLSKQSWGWWFETSSWPLWHHCNGCGVEVWMPQEKYVNVSADALAACVDRSSTAKELKIGIHVFLTSTNLNLTLKLFIFKFKFKCKFIMARARWWRNFTTIFTTCSVSMYRNDRKWKYVICFYVSSCNFIAKRVVHQRILLVGFIPLINRLIVLRSSYVNPVALQHISDVWYVQTPGLQ